MVYDSNGFNYQGNSILEKYDTSMAGDFSTKSSGFTKSGTDVSTLITPAFENGAGTAQTGSGTNGSYTGLFSNSSIDFDDAFAKTSPSIKPHVDAASAPIYWWSIGDYRVCIWDTNSSVTFTFSKCLTSGSANSNYQITPDHPDEDCYIQIVGGGGGGGSQGKDLSNNLHVGGPGGGGGGTLLEMEYFPKDDRTLSFYLGAGGGKGDGTGDDHYSGKSGSSTLIQSDDSNKCYAYGGQGGVFAGGDIANPGGSTGGGHAWSTNAHDTGYAAALTGDGYSTTFGQLTTTGHTNQLKIRVVNRNKGGGDAGYGYGGGGGGGAGGAGGDNQGTNRINGGNGGAAKTTWSYAYFGGGGPGGGQLNYGSPGSVPYGYGLSYSGCGGKGGTDSPAYGDDGSQGGVLFSIKSSYFSTGNNYYVA